MEEEKKTIKVEQFAFDSKGRVKFFSFVNFTKKIDQNLISSISSIGLSLVFGVIFLVFTLLAIKMTLGLGVKVAYTALTTMLSLAGFSFSLYSLNEAFQNYKLKQFIKEGIPTDSPLFYDLIVQEKERQTNQLLQKQREIQKHQSYLEELQKYQPEIVADTPNKIIQI